MINNICADHLVWHNSYTAEANITVALNISYKPVFGYIKMSSSIENAMVDKNH